MTETAGLLVCDHVAPEFLDLHSDMFGRLLGPEGFELKVFEVIAGELPDPVERCDAWTVTSSRYSVYDDEVLATGSLPSCARVPPRRALFRSRRRGHRRRR